MQRKTILGLIAGTFFYFSSAHDIKINEIVTDPQQDYDSSGSITDSDEYTELFNESATETYNLKGWKLELIDTTPESANLEEIFLLPRNFYVLQNPRGSQNNSGEIRLFDNLSNLVDSVIYGNWTGSILPSGNSSGLDDESLSSYPDGSANWVKSHSSKGTSNKAPVIGPFLTAYVPDTNFVRVNVSAVPGKRFILQKASRLGDWSNVITNNFEGTSFSVDENTKGYQGRFYRAKEYQE